MMQRDLDQGRARRLVKSFRLIALLILIPFALLLDFNILIIENVSRYRRPKSHQIGLFLSVLMLIMCLLGGLMMINVSFFLTGVNFHPLQHVKFTILLEFQAENIFNMCHTCIKSITVAFLSILLVVLQLCILFLQYPFLAAVCSVVSLVAWCFL